MSIISFDTPREIRPQHPHAKVGFSPHCRIRNIIDWEIMKYFIILDSSFDFKMVVVTYSSGRSLKRQLKGTNAMSLCHGSTILKLKELLVKYYSRKQS